MMTADERSLPVAAERSKGRSFRNIMRRTGHGVMVGCRMTKRGIVSVAKGWVAFCERLDTPAWEIEGTSSWKRHQKRKETQRRRKHQTESIVCTLRKPQFEQAVRHSSHPLSPRLSPTPEASSPSLTPPKLPREAKSRHPRHSAAHRQSQDSSSKLRESPRASAPRTTKPAPSLQLTEEVLAVHRVESEKESLAILETEPLARSVLDESRRAALLKCIHTEFPVATSVIIESRTRQTEISPRKIQTEPHRVDAPSTLRNQANKELSAPSGRVPNSAPLQKSITNTPAKETSDREPSRAEQLPDIKHLPPPRLSPQPRENVAETTRVLMTLRPTTAPSAPEIKSAEKICEPRRSSLGDRPRPCQVETQPPVGLRNNVRRVPELHSPKESEKDGSAKLESEVAPQQRQASPSASSSALLSQPKKAAAPSRSSGGGHSEASGCQMIPPKIAQTKTPSEVSRRSSDQEVERPAELESGFHASPLSARLIVEKSGTAPHVKDTTEFAVGGHDSAPALEGVDDWFLPVEVGDASGMTHRERMREIGRQKTLSVQQRFRAHTAAKERAAQAASSPLDGPVQVALIIKPQRGASDGPGERPEVSRVPPYGPLPTPLAESISMSRSPCDVLDPSPWAELAVHSRANLNAGGPTTAALHETMDASPQRMVETPSLMPTRIMAGCQPSRVGSPETPALNTARRLPPLPQTTLPAKTRVLKSPALVRDEQARRRESRSDKISPRPFQVVSRAEVEELRRVINPKNIWYPPAPKPIFRNLNDPVCPASVACGTLCDAAQTICAAVADIFHGTMDAL